MQSARGAGLSIGTDTLGETETIALTFPSDLAGQIGRRGTLTVHFDPQRGLLPVAYRLERFTGSEDNRTVRWFEAMRVLEVERCEGRWSPSRFQLLQSNALPTAHASKAVYDVSVESLTFGHLAPADLDFTFPAGTRVIDRVRKVGFVADGQGGAQGPVRSIADGRLIRPAALATGFSAQRLLLINLGFLIMLAGVILLRRHLRRPPDTEASPEKCGS